MEMRNFVLFALVLLFCYVPCANAAEVPELPVTDTEFALGEIRWSDDMGYYEAGYGNYPHIDGSIMCAPLIAAFAQEHLGISESSAETFINAQGAEYAFECFRRGDMVGNALLRDESVYMEAAPYTLLMTPLLKEEENLHSAPIAMDALVIIVDENNPVQSLSLEQVRDIFAGKLRNWSEVGGPDCEIIPYQGDEVTSGEARAMLQKLVMQGEALAEPVMEEYWIPSGIPAEDGGSDDPYVIDVVASFQPGQESIGFGIYSMVKQQEGIKMLDIENVAASVENQISGDYPLTFPYYATIFSADLEAAPGAFLDWILSEEGKTCIEKAGYIPAA